MYLQGRSIRIFAALLIFILLLAACTPVTTGGLHETDANKAVTSTGIKDGNRNGKPVELQFYLPPEQPNDMQAVVDEFYRKTKNTLNIHLVLNFVPFADIQSKVSVKLSAGEAVDLVYNAPWQTMEQMVVKDQYLCLDKYFNNSKYPGLKQAFSEELLKNNQFADKNGEHHLFGIPLTRNYGGAGGIYIRRDLREKYGLDEISSVSELENFFDKVLAYDKELIPLGFDGSLDSLVSVVGNDSQLVSGKNNQLVIVGLSVQILDGGKVVVSGKDVEDKEYRSALPPPLNTESPYKWYRKVREWYKKGYVEKDVISQKNALGYFKAGKFASVLGAGCNTQDTYDYIVSSVERSNPGAKVEFFPLHQAIREMKPGYIGTDFKAWNFQCIPVSSRKADTTMRFYDWLFSSQENHDLFELGIQGKHYIPVGVDKYSVPEKTDTAENYNLIGFQFTWNPTMIRYPITRPEKIKEIDRAMADPKFFYKLPLAGFNFNLDPVKSEIAKMSQVLAERRAVELGMVEDIEGTLDLIQKKLEEAGIQRVREEVKKQVEAWLKSRK